VTDHDLNAFLQSLVIPKLTLQRRHGGAQHCHPYPGSRTSLFAVRVQAVMESIEKIPDQDNAAEGTSPRAMGAMRNLPTPPDRVIRMFVGKIGEDLA
jgi:hypothetical protein